MRVCKNCGRKFNKDMPQPVKCYCEGKSIVVPHSDIKNTTSSLGKFLGENKQKSRDYWAKLHTYALIKEWNEQNAQTWYKNWEQNIPNINCSCRKHWFDMTSKEEFKPDFTSAESFFKWSIKVHNEVNTKLNKIVMKYEEACKLYGFGV